MQRAICLWVLDPPERDAHLANLALQKPVPDCKVLVEIACMRSPEDLLATRRAYRCLYRRSLEEDLASRTTGDIRKVSNFLTSKCSLLVLTERLARFHTAIGCNGVCLQI